MRFHREHFGCAVKFNAARNALVFRKADLEEPFVTHNPELLAAVAPTIRPIPLALTARYRIIEPPSRVRSGACASA